MNQREINTKMKEIKAALKEFGFKKSRNTVDYDYNYEVGGLISIVETKRGINEAINKRPS